ncbi:DUF2452 domain-containing protein [Gilvibacter sp. SZ-19]|jgi:hypothetical protein|uniref:DUF2452 domain-containing protein n=2 Tax=Gilvibacter TaxID=379070 RepID=UPI000B3D2E91|nr:DUF2452 domain-containing protein [Gilvibacter sp. SZ-19]ARV13372.1 GTP-binding protein [Gilvibacter sp. SZ-19]
MAAKKPDNVVYNEEEQRYDAALKPYATNVGAPAITAADNSGWKLASVKTVNERFKAKFEDIHKQYQELTQQYERNQLVYNAKFSFEPQLGQVYHLYRDSQMQPFLSIIRPEECNFDYVGSYRINADRMWEEVQRAASEE